MKKNIDIIKVANLGKAGASVFSKLAIDGDPSLKVEKPKVEKPKVEKPKVVKPKITNHDSIANSIAAKDPKFKARLDSVRNVAKMDSLKIDKEFKDTMREINVADSLRNQANREAFVQDSTNYGGIIARIKRTFGF